MFKVSRFIIFLMIMLYLSQALFKNSCLLFESVTVFLTNFWMHKNNFCN